MRNFAKKKGFKLGNREMVNIKTNKNIVCKSEHDIFNALGMKYVEPAQRIFPFHSIKTR